MTQDQTTTNSLQPIGVFDSGIGGLSVLAALRDMLPHENFIYLGDTARLPYGTKSRATVCAYAGGMTKALLDHDIKALVVACNTASAYAMDTIRAMTGDIPVIGMVEPAAEAALNRTQTGHILVIGTDSTIRSHVYPDALKAGRRETRVTSRPCQLLVALAEEGWHDGEIAEATVRAYMRDSLDMPARQRPDTVVMGCTHFPVFRPVFSRVLGSDTNLINCGAAAAEKLAAILPSPCDASRHGTVCYYATDSPARFAAGARLFGHSECDEANIEIIDVTGHAGIKP